MTEQLEKKSTLGDASTPNVDEAAGKNSPNGARKDTSGQNILLAAKGGSITFAGTMFGYASRLFIGILLGRFLGAELYGLYALSLPIAEVAAGLAVLGLTQAMVRYIAMYRNRQDTEGIWGTLQVGLGVTSIASLIVAVGLYFLAEPIALQLFDEPRLIPLLRLASTVVPLLVLAEVAAAATQGFKQMQYSVIASSFTMPMMRILLISGLAITAGLTVAGVLIIHAISLAVSCVLLLYFLNKLFPLRRPIRTGRRNIRELLDFSLPIYLSRLVRTFGAQIQTVLLGMFRTVSTVGIFSVASQVNRIGDFFHQSIITASAPIFSELYDQNDQEQMSRFYQTMTKWTFSLNLPLFLILFLFPEPILGIFGRDFIGGATALSILAWRNLINAGTGICGVVLGMTGKTKLKLINTTISVVLTIGLNIVLIPTWGLVGAAVAALASTAISNLLPLIEVFFLYRLLPYNLSFIKPTLAGVIVVVTILWIQQWLAIEIGLISLIVNSSILLTLYFTIVLLLGLSEEDRLVLSRLYKRLSIKFSRS